MMMMMRGRGVGLVMVIGMAMLSLALGKSLAGTLDEECVLKCVKGCPEYMPPLGCQEYCDKGCTIPSLDEDCVLKCVKGCPEYMPPLGCQEYCDKGCTKLSLASNQDGSHYCNLGCAAAKCTTLMRTTLPKDQVAATEEIKACFKSCSDVCSTSNTKGRIAKILSA